MDLFQHQRDNVARLSTPGPRFLMDEVGTGKSASMIMSAVELGAGFVLAVVPLSACWSFAAEVERWAPGRWNVCVWLGGRQPWPHNATFLIVPWSALQRESRWRQLDSYARGCDVVLLDEAHRAKTPGALRTVQVYGPELNGHGGLVQEAPHVWLSSGTPMPRHGGELWTHLHTLWPMSVSHCESYDDWVEHACQTKLEIIGSRRVRKVIGTKAEIIGPMSAGMKARGLWMRTTKKQALPELPPQRFRVVPQSPPDDLTERMILELEPAAQKKVAALMRREELGLEEALEELGPHWPTLRRILGLAKVQPVADYVRDRLEDGAVKVLVFAHHRRVVERLTKALEFYEPLQLMGGTRQQDRQQFEQRWQTNLRHRVAVLQMDAAGEALTLHADGLCCDVVFAELSGVPGTVVQAAARPHRIGQPNPVQIDLISLRETLDDQLMHSLLRRVEDITSLTGDKPLEVA